jgi:hypothetical protein
MIMPTQGLERISRKKSSEARQHGTNIDPELYSKLYYGACKYPSPISIKKYFLTGEERAAACVGKIALHTWICLLLRWVMVDTKKLAVGASAG